MLANLLSSKRLLVSLLRIPAVQVLIALGNAGLNLWTLHDLLVGLIRTDGTQVAIALLWLMPWAHAARMLRTRPWRRDAAPMAVPS